MPGRVFRLNTVPERTGRSRLPLYRKVRAGTFPTQVRIAEQWAGWREGNSQTNAGHG